MKRRMGREDRKVEKDVGIEREFREIGMMMKDYLTLDKFKMTYRWCIKQLNTL